MLRRPGETSAALFLGLTLFAGRMTAAEGLAVDPNDPRFSDHPDLVAKLAATPHGYFRFVNAAFAAETCRLFADVAASLPEVNLHGDAHVEQYAVTSLGRGLTDFDDCTRGKAVIDLVRFGASLLLAGFFNVKRVGALTMGVGSALDEKYLIIVEGDTAAAEDDLVVEAKQIRDLVGNPCVRTDVGASRVLDGQRLIAYEPFAYAAVVPHGNKFFWMHDWRDDYREASIGSVILSARDLREVAYDAGVQMGRAHPKRPDGGSDKDRRQAALKSLDAIEARVRAAIREMAARTEAAWQAFRQKAAAR